MNLQTLADQLTRLYPRRRNQVPEVTTSFYATALVDQNDELIMDANDLPSFVTKLLGTAGAAIAALALSVKSLLVTGTAGGLGYGTGAGGTVTQITSSSTGVTLDTYSGQITTVALTTAGAAEEVFVLTNAKIGVKDTISTGTTYAGAGTPAVSVKGIAAGSCTIVVTNLSASALNALMVINFNVIKGA